MILIWKGSASEASSVPRVGGGDPNTKLNNSGNNLCSPRRRG